MTYFAPEVTPLPCVRVSSSVSVIIESTYFVQEAALRGAVRKHTDRPGAWLYRPRLEDPVLRRRQEERRAAAVKIVIEVDEEGEARVDGGVGVVDVRRRRSRLIQRRRRPSTVDLRTSYFRYAQESVIRHT